MTTKKNTEKAVSEKQSHAVASKTAETVPVTVDAVPANVTAPPQGWVKPAKIGRRGRHPSIGLSIVTPALVAELREKAKALSSELGPNAVDPAQLAGALEQANAWSKTAQDAETFSTYARTQRAASWDSALGSFQGLRLGVRFAVARDPSFAERFPNVAKAYAVKKRAKAKPDTAPEQSNVAPTNPTPTK